MLFKNSNNLFINLIYLMKIMFDIFEVVNARTYHSRKIVYGIYYLVVFNLYCLYIFESYVNSLHYFHFLYVQKA
jgi:hypothetical protein